MARDPVIDAIVCTSCGTKFNAERDRCPRCRTKVTQVDPTAIARRSSRMQAVGFSLLGLAVAGFTGIWIVAARKPAVSAAVPVAPAPRVASASVPPPTPAPRADADRLFMDAPSRGTEAYHAGDPETALKQYLEAIEKNPRDVESLNNAGQMLVRLGRTAEALPYYDRALQEKPDRWSYVFNRARAYGLLSRWPEAIADYRKAQELFPNDYATTFNLALTLHKSGDETGAVAEYEKAITLAPEDGSFRRALAISLERLDRKADAASAYGEYLRLSPAAPDADKVKERIAMLTGAAVTPAPPPPVSGTADKLDPLTP